MKHSRDGVVEGLYLGLQADTLVTTPVNKVEVTFEGFVGDKHSGWTRLSDSRTPQYQRGTLIRNDRQVSLVSCEELAKIAQNLNILNVQPEWLGANLLIGGIPRLTRLPPPAHLCFEGGVVLAVTGENLPCRRPGKIIQQHYPEKDDLAHEFVRAARGLRGLVAVVEHLGAIRLGEKVRVYPPSQYLYRP